MSCIEIRKVVYLQQKGQIPLSERHKLVVEFDKLEVLFVKQTTDVHNDESVKDEMKVWK